MNDADFHTLLEQRHDYLEEAGRIEEAKQIRCCLGQHKWTNLKNEHLCEVLSREIVSGNTITGMNYQLVSTSTILQVCEHCRMLRVA